MQQSRATFGSIRYQLLRTLHELLRDEPGTETDLPVEAAVLRHSFRAFIAKSSVEQGKAPTAEVTSCELRKKVGIYLCVYIHVNIIVKVEYSSRERSGLGATMAHQLKVERSKSCGQLLLLSKGFYRNLLW